MPKGNLLLPRGLTVDQCLTCRRVPDNLATTAEWVAYNEHRTFHYRVDRRRAQYRASKKRALLREWQAIRDQNRVGSLHSLSCDGQHVKPRKGCTPIAVYADQRRSAA